MTAAQIVKRLLENEDLKDFLAQNRDLGLDQVFVAHGWAVRGPFEYGKMNSDGTVRWIVEIDDRSDNRASRLAATFSGEKLFTGEDRHGRAWREWQEFEIPSYIVLSSWMTAEDFVNEIEEHLHDQTGPEDRYVPEPDYDEY